MAKKRRPPRPRKGKVFQPKPAPGDLEIVQSFLNTRHGRSRIDRLTTVDELASWLGRWRLVASSEKLSEADLERARELREGLRALLVANSGFGLDVSAVPRLDASARGARIEFRFDPEGSARYETVSAGFSGAVATLLGIVSVAQLTGRWSRMKSCAYGDCRGIFYDTSPNRTGKWCTRQCGELMRARAQRRRDPGRVARLKAEGWRG